MSEVLRVLTLGDLHFKTSNVRETTNMCSKILEYIQNNLSNIDVIMVMGDVLDRHEHIHVVPLTQSIKFLYDLSKLKKTYVLIGNHDRPNNNDFLSDYHPFVGVGDDNLTIVDKVTLITLKSFKFVLVPYVYPGRFQEALDTKKTEITNPQEIDCFFCHQEFYGTTMGAVVSTVGDRWPKDVSYIISGHIHDYCRPQENIVYVGTPIQHAFGDRDDKTISMFTFDKREFTIGEENTLKQKYPKENRIDLKLLKRIACRVKCKDVIKWIPPEGYLIKLIITGTSSEIKAILKLEYLKVLSKKGVKICYDSTTEIIENYGKTLKMEESRLPYAARLKESIKENPRHQYWFDKLFNRMT